MVARARRAYSPAVKSSVGIENVDQVMGNSAAFGQRQFGRADIEVAIHLQGVAVDNFAVELFRDQKCEIALSGSGGTGDCNQWSFGCVCGYGVRDFCGQTPLYNEKRFSSLSGDAARPKRE